MKYLVNCLSRHHCCHWYYNCNKSITLLSTTYYFIEVELKNIIPNVTISVAKLTDVLKP